MAPKQVPCEWACALRRVAWNEQAENEYYNSSDGAASGSLTTGWCDVYYDAGTNEITVVLSPDKTAILGINKAQLTDIALILADAVKEVVLDDILADFGGMDIITDGLTAENVWDKALETYLNKYYADVTDETVTALYLMIRKWRLSRRLSIPLSAPPE